MALQQEVIDREVLRSTRDSVPHGAAIVARVIKAWLRDAPSRLEEIQAAVEAGDVEAAHRLVHSLKSASATIGANALAAHCRTAEVSFAQGALSRDLVAEIERQHEAARAEVLQMLEAEL